MKLPIKYAKASSKKRKQARAQYIAEQDGKCMFCKEDLTASPPESVTDKPIDWDLFPTHFLRHPIHLQHDHITDQTEGAVHAYCNAVLWQYHGR